MKTMLMMEYLVQNYLAYVLVITGAVIVWNTWRTACKDIKEERS